MLTAGKKALADAGITEEVLGKLVKRRCGVIVGSALGGMGVSTSSDYLWHKIDCSLSSCFRISNSFQTQNYFLSVISSTTCIFKRNFNQTFQDGIEALRVSYKKINPFGIPFATTNIGSALLAMDLVSLMPMFVEI